MRYLTHQLMHLVAIIDQGSMSRAAQQLNVTQPALSRSIRYLETEVDAKLLHRGRGGATPTKLGRQLYTYGRNVLASLDRAAADVEAWHKHDCGHLIVGSTALPSVYFVPSAIADFLEVRPKVGLRYEIHPMNELLLMLRQRTIDVFVGALAFEKPPEEVETTLLLDENLAIICAADHPLAIKKKWGIKELQDYPWILPAKDTILRGQAEAAFTEFGLTNVEITIETVVAAAIIPLMRRGAYLTMHSPTLLAPEIASGNLVVLSEKIPCSRRALTAFHRSEEEMAELDKAFVAHLKAFAATLKAPVLGDKFI